MFVCPCACVLYFCSLFHSFLFVLIVFTMNFARAKLVTCNRHIFFQTMSLSLSLSLSALFNIPITIFFSMYSLLLFYTYIYKGKNFFLLQDFICYCLTHSHIYTFLTLWLSWHQQQCRLDFHIFFFYLFLLYFSFDFFFLFLFFMCFNKFNNNTAWPKLICTRTCVHMYAIKQYRSHFIVCFRFCFFSNPGNVFFFIVVHCILGQLVSKCWW